MDLGLLVICGLTFVIHLIGTLAYSVRIAGSRTGGIALSLSLFNILILLSRTSNSFQAPLLAKRVEQRLAAGSVVASTADFRWLLVSATLATIVGAFLIPTFQRPRCPWMPSVVRGPFGVSPRGQSRQRRWLISASPWFCPVGGTSPESTEVRTSRGASRS